MVTNGDRIRAMSDEELVGIFGMVANGNIFDLFCDNPKRTVECDSRCFNCIREWLKQPAEEET